MDQPENGQTTYDLYLAPTISTTEMPDELQQMPGCSVEGKGAGGMAGSLFHNGIAFAFALHAIALTFSHLSGVRCQ